MQNKKAIFRVKGMTRDLSVSKFNSDYAYDIRNMRLVATDEETSYSLVNEKGTLDSGVTFTGTPIGQSIINDKLILFSAKPGEDKIYKVEFNPTTNTLESSTLYTGDLNFDPKHPIEAISIYENEGLEKVYWVDGLNQPRVINIDAPQAIRSTWNNNSFDFVRKLALKETVSITKNTVAGGIFAPGIIQYCFTYYNLYGQESNIFYTSPLFYVSYNNRGASPEDTVSNSFTITINGGTYDKSFDYIRVYCIHRTSLDTIPQARRVADLAVPTGSSNPNLVYTDNGTEGNTIDPTELLYVGGEEVIFGAMSQKDNTLFLGDINMKRPTITADIKNALRGGTISFDARRYLDNPAPSGIYPYSNQLKYSSSSIKTLKYLEYYRFGIQAQHYTGKWSEPIWINDAKNTAAPSIDPYNEFRECLPQASYILNNSTIIQKLINNGYVKIRPVIVFPKLSERAVVCQGVLAPTVYNVGDRAGNSPFAQSSWFFRPNSYLDVEEEAGTWTYPTPADPRSSWAARVRNDNVNVSVGSSVISVNNFNKGKWLEFRHNHSLPQCSKENAEIQCLWKNHEEPYVSFTPSNLNPAINFVADDGENFFVDQSIVTLHSPDIEFDTQVRSLDTAGLKLRIVGSIPLTASISDISIQASTPVNNFCKEGASTESSRKYYTEFPMGEYKETITSTNLSDFGWRAMISGGFWFDDLSGYKPDTGNTNKYSTGFVIYPWHRNGSYNNTKNADASGYRSAKTDKKKMSVLRFSYSTSYYASQYIWNAYEENSSTKTGISDVVIFDSNEISLVKLKGPANSGLDIINYYGNIDKILTYTSTNSLKKDGYPIVVSGVQDASSNAHTLVSGNYILPDDPNVAHPMKDYTNETTAFDPVSIKYKSTPHAVIALNYATNHYQRVLPTAKYVMVGSDSKIANSVNGENTDGNSAFWDKNCVSTGVSQDVLNAYPIYGYLWLGELYNDDPALTTTRFGGTTEEAFENNLWLPAGEAQSLLYNDQPRSTIQVFWTEGDTYFQRYDCLKTYPFTQEDANSVVDILSFMCETRVNIDGRYDRNRGQTNNLAITPENFNLFNPVYSQSNNFFNYRGVNSDRVTAKSFPNNITWTKTKTPGEEIDSWTNITLASTLELDGDKGRVRALRRFNNNLIAFQDKGISNILYNENVQIASTTGVPIEIANSGKVQGKRYISDKVGCTNKWSICETPNGLYFVDDITKDIYAFNSNGLDNISDRLGFHSWMTNNFKGVNIWNPVDFNSCISYYDKKNSELYFITKNECLTYSEYLNQFTSFYNYEKVPYLATLKDRTVMVRDNTSGVYKAWLQHEGNYNEFFGVTEPFSATIIVNPEPTEDKVFNTLEFRSDTWSGDGDYLPDNTFDTLTTENEYQKGINTLVDNNRNIPSNLKKKFRIWRANIPRNTLNVGGNYTYNYTRDRMRNPWIKLKLSKETPNYNKTILHDMVVDYFV